MLILIKEIPLQPGERITEEDVLGILNPKDIKDFLPDGATYINSGKLTLENLPGFWAHYQVNMSRVKSKVAMEIIMYTIFYNNKLIQIQGQVTNSINGKPTNRGGLNKYEKLFDLMTNSFVIANMYK